MKKYLWITVIVIISFLIIRQFIWYNKYDGNLLIYISNMSEMGTTSIEVFIDGNTVINDVLTNENFHGYKSYPFKESFGKHSLLIKNTETATIQEIEFRLFFMEWLIIDFVHDDLIPKNNPKRYSFIIDKQFKPLTIQ